MQNVKLISITAGVGNLKEKSAQDIISYVARVSNPNNQNNFDTSSKLLKYCIQHKHWSPFEHAWMTVEIATSRAIAAQILRHRSFSFQEFSLRYQEASGAIVYQARRQDVKNRQNSTDNLPIETKEWFQAAQEVLTGLAFDKYREALDKGIAKESARFLLPLNTATRLYMTGTARSWIHYIDLRTDPSTQLEHRELAEEIKEIFSEQFPDIAKAMEWCYTSDGSQTKEK